MDGYSQNAEQLKQELRVLKTKYIEVDAEQKCERCTRPIIQEEFYAFPCVHSYHKSCLLKTVRESAPEPAKLAKIEDLDRRISELVKKGQLAAISQPSNPRTPCDPLLNTSRSTPAKRRQPREPRFLPWWVD